LVGPSSQHFGRANIKKSQVVGKGLELGRQIAVDLEPDADFN
jgi:hypothetical protein